MNIALLVGSMEPEHVRVKSHIRNYLHVGHDARLESGTVEEFICLVSRDRNAKEPGTGEGAWIECESVKDWYLLLSIALCPADNVRTQ